MNKEPNDRVPVERTVRQIIEQLHAAASDPMWANHCELNKATAMQAANELEKFVSHMEKIADLCAGYDEYGSTGPKEPFCWETVGRLAIDYARYCMTPNAN